MSNEIQKDDYLLPGDLGNITIASTGENRKITQLVKNKKDKSVIMTLSQAVDNHLNGIPVTEDAECEIIDNRNCVFDVKKIEDRLIELGALEDAEFEIIKPKQIEQ